MTCVGKKVKIEYFFKKIFNSYVYVSVDNSNRERDAPLNRNIFLRILSLLVCWNKATFDHFSKNNTYQYKNECR